MRKYKAIILDGKRLLRQGALLLLLCGSVLAGSVLLVSILPQIVEKVSLHPQKILEETIPVLVVGQGEAATVQERLGERGRQWMKRILQFDKDDPATILTCEIPLAAVVKQGGLWQMAEESSPSAKEPMTSTVPQTGQESLVRSGEEKKEIPIERQAPIREIDGSPALGKEGKVVISNETSYEVDGEALLQEKPSIVIGSEGPQVLVVHTHGTEAYGREGSTVYDIEAGDRSEDPQKNVVRVGEVFCQVLEAKGIGVIHDKTLHDTPSFNGSYAHSLQSIEKYLKEYPSIGIVLDIHRDSIVYDDKTKAKPTTEIQGKKAAQLMFVVGTDQTGLENPNWRENLKHAVHFQKVIINRYPTLMRHINLRRERFNGHTTTASMIIEVGSGGNSLSEAIYGATLAGECVGDYINSLGEL